MRLLLIEDEKPLSAAIKKLLEQEHFAVDTAFTGPDGLDCALTGIYDAIILDVMLPGMDGFSVLSALRAQKMSTPVLMLTAHGELLDRVQGLNLGADYYLPKPFERSELVACLNAITRRKDAPPVQALSFGDVSLNPQDASLCCVSTGKRIKLVAKEYLLMELFLRNPGQLLPKETIVERVWGFEDEAEYNSLSVYLTFLRRKIDFIGAHIEIRASRGLGYTLEEKP